MNEKLTIDELCDSEKNISDFTKFCRAPSRSKGRVQGYVDSTDGGAPALIEQNTMLKDRENVEATLADFWNSQTEGK